MSMLGWKQRSFKKSVKIGLENEMTGLTRLSAIQSVCEVVGASHFERSHHLDGFYCFDADGKKWEVCSDSSVTSAPQSVELVTPILENSSDIEKYLNVINKLVEKGAYCDASCGLHVHVSHPLIGVEELKRLLQHMVTRQDLLFRFCNVIENRIEEYSQPTSEKLAREAKKVTTMSGLKDVWYKNYGGSEYSHYSYSRYHNLNLHSFFEGKGIEFRLFNGTVDIEKIEAIIDICQGFTMDAINSVYMRSYIHTDRTIYSNPDRMYTLLETYISRMQLEPKTRHFLLTECL